MVHLAGPEDRFCCTKCGSCHVDLYDDDGKKHIACLDCGHEEVYSAKNRQHRPPPLKQGRMGCC